MKLQNFKELGFLQAIKALFNELNVPINYVADEPTSIKDILKDTYKDNSTFQLVDEVYFVGMVDDAAFDGNKSLAVDKIKSDYDGILLFGVSLHQRENNLPPTRSQLAEVTRAFNREFYYTPVVVIFKYFDDKTEYIAFANTERIKYKQEWREGEKAGKVSLLRDIDIQKPHPGHQQIINELQIQTSGIKAVDSFAKLYTYWQEVFSVSILNKRFYQELSNWYFWAIKQVTFPSKPTEIDAHKKNAKLDDLIQEHNATNVIRLLTRLLFTWFIKEKKLIPEELFNLEALQSDILNEIAPYHENGLFKQSNLDSVYYKTILQNLFFASLNCPIKSDGTDTRERSFRSDKYGTHRGIDYLMRYKRYFKKPETFLQMMNNTVPFLNGGLFECLDDKDKNIYIDGFSDNMTKGEQLIVPDYLFFGVEEHVDLSAEYGVSNSSTKKAAVKGLINILKSYKFTITENTPIEEDVALDPELLGKVFENLLASYNPETKSTARKQTGSFYTPREIVNYMVDESLIAYMKNTIVDWGIDKKQIDEKLHRLASFDLKNPFEENAVLTREIILALDKCKILDPACGSGAFPMGALQKMVHILQKLDPENIVWKEIQIAKVQEEMLEAFNSIEDKEERGKKLNEINDAFDKRINDPDYARKLYLIENCIYGIDIQPIATQISKLRFFISLVVDQKRNKEAENFGIRPLPNLETKFVAANTLIGIEKLNLQTKLFNTKELSTLEENLKGVRHKLFSARTKETKNKYRQKDELLRNKIAELLEIELNNEVDEIIKNDKRNSQIIYFDQIGNLEEAENLKVELNTLRKQFQSKNNTTSRKLANWDPYNQNASSSFFDPEWMFDISEGFDIVIGNPPYILIQNIPNLSDNTKYSYNTYNCAQYKIDLYHLFIEKGIGLLKKGGTISYITPNTFIKNKHNNKLREIIYKSCSIYSVVLFYTQVFESVSVDNLIFVFIKNKPRDASNVFEIRNSISDITVPTRLFDQDKITSPDYVFNFDNDIQNEKIISQIIKDSFPLKNYGRAYFGIQTHDRNTYVSNIQENGNWKPVIDGGNVFPYKIAESTEFVNFVPAAIKSGGNISVYERQRIVIRQVGKYPEGAICEPGIFTLNTIYNIFLTKSEIKLELILAIINSKIIRYYWLATNFDNKITFPKIKKAPIENIPIKSLSPYNLVIETLVFLLKQTNTLIRSIFIEVIDALVFELYFPIHMKERDIDVRKFIERDIEKVMQNREFKELNDIDKGQVLLQLYQTWIHPDNEVRNRMKLFAVRSPELLKPILES
ncbi:MAG: N-6 DNA methylase [Bacteroidetes bacterium]|nr:N-6 DNA methylase [Bacteroidota bacterium]